LKLESKIAELEAAQWSYLTSAFAARI
jgi:hypothetical protein